MKWFEERKKNEIKRNGKTTEVSEIRKDDSVGCSKSSTLMIIIKAVNFAKFDQFLSLNSITEV